MTNSANVTINLQLQYPELMELAKHVRVLLENSQGFGSAIEMDHCLSGDDWTREAEDILGRLRQRIKQTPSDN